MRHGEVHRRAAIAATGVPDGGTGAEQSDVQPARQKPRENVGGLLLSGSMRAVNGVIVPVCFAVMFLVPLFHFQFSNRVIEELR